MEEENLDPTPEELAGSLEPELFMELNVLYGEAPQDQKRFPLLLRFLSLGLALVFTIYLFGNLFAQFTAPSLSFLSSSRELKQREFVQLLEQAVVEINSSDYGVHPQLRRGTGFNIAEEGLIVTNRHIVENAPALTIVFPRGQVFLARKWYMHPTEDLAIIPLNGKDLPLVSLNLTQLPVLGEEVLIIGNPLGFPRVAMKGELINYVQVGSAVSLIFEAPIHEGSSGSPVFDSDGRVLGVVYATIKRDPSLPIQGLAVPILRVQELLDRVQN